MKKHKHVEVILYGVLQGHENWEEVVLSTNPYAFDKVKELAAKDGYTRFRVAEIDLDCPPDFSQLLNKSRGN